MKKTGIIIFIIGLALSLFTGFRFVTREKVVDIGKLQISANKTHSISWSPIVGGIAVALGAGLYLAGRKNSTSM
jgi:UDP-N-acetylmuramyl pentapeptide phosphotransferase/UDP-N-acetylglucosamine-1-phosphate transferase